MEHISPTKTYIGIWIALMCLTALTAGMSRIDLGPFNTVIALVIATGKGLLVVLFFMHAKYISERTTWVAIVSGFFWLLILLMLSMTDYFSRSWR
jgi:cytochrome c oxidase subunit IV